MDTFTVKWSQFTVLKKHDVDRDKPFLWVFGIVVDGDTVLSEDYIIRRPSSSENLGGKKFKKGDQITVPSGLDISRQIKPWAGLETAGVVVLAWENATTRDRTITQAYNDAAVTLNNYVAELVNKAKADLLAGVPFDEIDVEVSDSDVAALEADLRSTIRDSIRRGSGLFQAIPDHNIGSAHTIESLKDPVTKCLEYSFTNGSTHYELEGDLVYPTPPPKVVREPTEIPPKHQEPKIQALP